MEKRKKEEEMERDFLNRTELRNKDKKFWMGLRECNGTVRNIGG